MCSVLTLKFHMPPVLLWFHCDPQPLMETYVVINPSKGELLPDIFLSGEKPHFSRELGFMPLSLRWGLLVCLIYLGFSHSFMTHFWKFLNSSNMKGTTRIKLLLSSLNELCAWQYSEFSSKCQQCTWTEYLDNTSLSVVLHLAKLQEKLN